MILARKKKSRSGTRRASGEEAKVRGVEAKDVGVEFDEQRVAVVSKKVENEHFTEVETETLKA